MTFGMIFFMIILIAGGISYLLFKKTVTLEKEFTTLEAYLNTPEVIKKVNEVEEKKKKLNEMKKYFSILEQINKNIDSVYVMNSAFIEKIAGVLPKELFINNLSVTLEDLQIQGTSNNRVAIAELEHNLKDLEMFYSVHISTISKESKESSNYIFNLICIFKDVKDNEDH